MKLQGLKGTVIGGILMAASWSAQAAVVVDLTTANSTGSIGGATYTQVPAQPTGSGVIDSFVRIKDNQSVVQGYNTTASNIYQNDGTNTFNHEITVGEVGLIDLNGAAAGGEVMRFLLDINQTGADPLLSLDEVQIFLSTEPNQFTEDPLAQGQLVPFNFSTLVYQMDAGGDNSVLLDYSLNGGSGSGDMTLDIPLSMLNAAFALGGYNTVDAQNGAYIYLYSRFSGNNDGYEEWAHFEGNPIGEVPCDPAIEDCEPREIPEPNGLALMSLGLLGAAFVVKRRRSHRRA